MPTFYMSQITYPTTEHSWSGPSIYDYSTTSSLTVSVSPSDVIYGVTVFCATSVRPNLRYRKNSVYYNPLLSGVNLSGVSIPNEMNWTIYAHHFHINDSGIDIIEITFPSALAVYCIAIHKPFTLLPLQSLRGDSISIYESGGIDSISNLTNILDDSESTYGTITFVSGVNERHVTLEISFSNNRLPHAGCFVVTPYVVFNLQNASGCNIDCWFSWGRSGIPQTSLNYTGSSSLGFEQCFIEFSSQWLRYYSSNQYLVRSSNHIWGQSNDKTSLVINNLPATVFSSSYTFAPYLGYGLIGASIYKQVGNNIIPECRAWRFGFYPFFVIGNSTNPVLRLYVHFVLRGGASQSPSLNIYDCGFAIPPQNVDIVEKLEMVPSSSFVAPPYNPYLNEVTRDGDEYTETEDVYSSEAIYTMFGRAINSSTHSVTYYLRSTSGDSSLVDFTAFHYTPGQTNPNPSTTVDTYTIPTTLTSITPNFGSDKYIMSVKVKPR